MSQLVKALSSEAGQLLVRQAISAAAGLIGAIPNADNGPSVVLEVCLLTSGQNPVPYYTQIVWVGSPKSTEQAYELQKMYGHRLARMGVISDGTEVGLPKAAHSVAGQQGDETQVLVIVAGAATETSYQLARIVAMGITLATMRL